VPEDWQPHSRQPERQRKRELQERSLEEAFGGQLSWQRPDDKRACRIAHISTRGGWGTDEERWPAIQDGMIDAMIRLEKALRPEIAALDLENPLGVVPEPQRKLTNSLGMPFVLVPPGTF
jgi:hypothetical protein